MAFYIGLAVGTLLGVFITNLLGIAKHGEVDRQIALAYLHGAAAERTKWTKGVNYDSETES